MYFLAIISVNIYMERGRVKKAGKNWGKKNKQEKTEHITTFDLEKFEKKSKQEIQFLKLYCSNFYKAIKKKHK